MNQTVTFLAGVGVAGRLADGVGDFLLLVTSSVAISTALSSLFAY